MRRAPAWHCGIQDPSSSCFSANRPASCFCGQEQEKLRSVRRCWSPSLKASRKSKDEWDMTAKSLSPALKVGWENSPFASHSFGDTFATGPEESRVPSGGKVVLHSTSTASQKAFFVLDSRDSLGVSSRPCPVQDQVLSSDFRAPSVLQTVLQHATATIRYPHWIAFGGVRLSARPTCCVFTDGTL